MLPNTISTFRRADSNDIPSMSGIRLCVTENSLSDPGRITLQMYEDYLEKSGRGWVAEHEGEIVAFCYADKEAGAIWALFVCPRHEGRGYAKTLLKLATCWLFDLGHDCVRLSTGAGTRAERFYAAQGWLREPNSSPDIFYVMAKSGPLRPRD